MALRSNLRAPPKVARRLTGRGRLPDEKNLLRKTPEDLIRTLNRFGIDPDVKAIAAKADDAFRVLEEVIAKGQQPDAATWAAIEKRIENQVRATLVDMTKAAIRNYRIDKARREGGEFVWISVGDDRVCDSCDGRNGKVKTFKQWERSGLPGDSVLLCCSGPRKNCRCRLVPVAS